MQLFFPTIAGLFDMLPGAVSVVAAIVISFAVITLIASYYRFQHIVEMAEDTQPEEMGASAIDILRVQMARFLAGSARRGTSFSVALIRVNDSDMEVRMDSPFVEAVKQASRKADITCVFDPQTAALVFEAEPEDSVPILTRITSQVAQACNNCEDLRVGIASYPGHGLGGKGLLEIANQGLLEASEEQPIVLPEIVDLDEDTDEENEDLLENGEVKEDDPEQIVEEGAKSSGWKGRRKSAMLDDLTGVLKPSAVSAYMQRMMSDLRHKKKKAALFCIGVNNIDHVERFHGEEAADDVLVGVSKILQENLRADDLIGRHEKYAFLVLAEASLDEAEIIGKRISMLVQQRAMTSGTKKIKTTITLGVSAYPDHGRNLHALYQAGQKVLDYSRANDIRAYAVYDPKIHDSMPSKPMKSIKSFQA